MIIEKTLDHVTQIWIALEVSGQSLCYLAGADDECIMHQRASPDTLGKVRAADNPGGYQITGIQNADDQHPFDAADPASTDI